MEQEQAVAELFEPKNEKPLWEYIYDALKDFTYGDRFSYQQLETMTGISREKIQALKKKVDRELKKHHKKTLVNIRGYGYKIGDPGEQINQAHHHEGKGNRQIKWAAELLDNMDTESMSIEQKNNWLHYTTHLQNKLSFVRKRNLQSLEKTKEAKEKTKDSEQIQKESLDQLDYLMNQITQLKEKFS